MDEEERRERRVKENWRAFAGISFGRSSATPTEMKRADARHDPAVVAQFRYSGTRKNDPNVRASCALPPKGATA